MLSQDKSVAIIFSRREDQPMDQFRIDGSSLQWQQQVKFLGMVFDERLTWRAHIDFVINKCKKRLNLMRCIGGTNWGANKSTQLTIYKTLIRSVIDYGCAAYNSANKDVT